MNNAQKIFAFITEHCNAGKTVTLWTWTKGTSIKKKHLAMVKLSADGKTLWIQSGKRWLDYTYVSRVTAE
jgi:hypothetical protein